MKDKTGPKGANLPWRGGKLAKWQRWQRWRLWGMWHVWVSVAHGTHLSGKRQKMFDALTAVAAPVTAPGSGAKRWTPNPKNQTRNVRCFRH